MNGWVGEKDTYHVKDLLHALQAVVLHRATRHDPGIVHQAPHRHATGSRILGNVGKGHVHRVLARDVEDHGNEGGLAHGTQHLSVLLLAHARVHRKVVGEVYGSVVANARGCCV